jgi:hypothetical protein
MKSNAEKKANEPKQEVHKETEPKPKKRLSIKSSMKWRKW